jgi:cell wall-associated NlpC family hydrolase
MRKTVAIVGLALISAFAGMAGGAQRASAQTSGSPVTGAVIVQTALKYLGAPYTGTTTARYPSTGFSDVGFVVYVYNQNGIRLHINWARLGGGPLAIYHRILADGPKVKMADLQPGDVVYFKNTAWAGLSHIGIYIGDGKFVHAEWYNRGVTVTALTGDSVDGNYWTGRYDTANRPWSG